MEKTEKGAPRGAFFVWAFAAKNIPLSDKL